MGQFPINEVRHASKQTKVQNQTSAQSAKNISRGLIDFALAFLTNRLDSFTAPVNLSKQEVVSVDYNTRVTNQLAGFSITDENKYSEVVDSLESLGFKFLADQVEVPSYRNDVTHQQDIDEEIFRFYGYDSFKLQPIKTAPSHVEIERGVSLEVSMMGYQEVKTYSLTSEKKNVINPFNFAEPKQLETFVSKEREFVKNTCAITLLEVIEHNQKRKINNLNIFEQSMIANGEKVLALASTEKSFNQVKQDVVRMISGDLTFERITDNETINPSVSAYIKQDNRIIGWIGKVHPKLSKYDAFIAEVFIDGPKDVQFNEYSQDPLTTEDITFELSKGEDLESKIEESQKNVFDYRVIDRYIDGDIRKITVRFTKEK